MAYFKAVKCDWCSKVQVASPAHSIRQSRHLVLSVLGWYSFRLGRRILDICPKCMEGKDKSSVAFFIEQNKDVLFKKPEAFEVSQ